jgi:hypothetical protein
MLLVAFALVIVPLDLEMMDYSVLSHLLMEEALDTLGNLVMQ